jgi:hypothetical protein
MVGDERANGGECRGALQHHGHGGAGALPRCLWLVFLKAAQSVEKTK